MIDKISVTSLFGLYDYDISINPEITIIYGPNGCGKTTLLKMLNDLFSDNLISLYRVDFYSFRVHFDSGEELTIFKTDSISKQNIEDELKKIPLFSYRYINRDGSEYNYSPSDAVKNANESNSNIKFQNITFDRQLLSYLEDNKTSSKDYDKNIYRYFTNDVKKRLLENYAMPKIIREAVSKVDVRLISSDRLYTVIKKRSSAHGEETSEIEYRATRYSNEIAQRIRNALQAYAEFSQSKDRTFPIRAIEKKNELSIEEIKKKLLRLEEIRRNYANIGLLESESFPVDKLINSVTEETRRTLSLYINDTEEKLQSLQGLASSLGLLKKILENKYNEKTVLFSKNEGFILYHNATDRQINVTHLSSGEQQEFVLLYEFIFKTKSNSLVLIDEPELSLHIKWQFEFVDDLLKIIKMNHFSAIIATHSPQIIDDKWKLATSLT